MAPEPAAIDRGKLACVEEGVPAAIAGAILTIDLSAIRDNYLRLRARLGSAECAGVVKADAYGLGAAYVAPALQAAGCRSFFVAHVGEAMALRAALGRSSAIFVLNGLPDGAERECAEIDAVPVLNSLAQWRAWQALSRRLGRKLDAALQVDSGMGRLGLPPEDFTRLADDRLALEGIKLRLVMSHLACADEPEHPANGAQLAAFAALRALLPEAPASLANSSGIFLGDAYHFDLVRPGAALYGVNPMPGSANPMRPVVQLSARIIQVRSLPGGSGIGYGHTFRAETPSRIATVSLGYADGWPRCASAGAAFSHGVRLPFVGRVSMDCITIDVSALPQSDLEGAFVELFDGAQTVDDVARFAGTIGYEILTSLGRRFHRRYIGGRVASSEWRMANGE